jgi:tetratricopeptide (TPR) repeat protein
MTIQLTSEHSTARWIHNPALDLIVGCGAWSLPLILLGYSSLSNSPTWAIAFYGLALFLNYPHYMSTLYRAYHNESDFRKYRIFTIHITGLVLLTVLLSHLRFSLLPWIFTLYLTMSPWHYSGQNYGLFMMFTRRAGAQIEENTRQAIYSAFVLSYAILFLNLHTGPSDRLFLSIGIPEKTALVVKGVLAIAFVGFSIFGLRGLARQIGWKAMTPPLVLFSTQILWFFVPGLLAALKGISIPQSRYSTGVLPLMHSAQYLWITSYYARRESIAEGKEWRPFAYFAVQIVGGVALFVPGPWLASYVFHYDFTASFLIFTALVNIHHFILDGAIWKLRDGRIAALLLNTQERIASAAGAAASTAGPVWAWMRSQAVVPRAFRIATAIFLLALAGVDQTRYAFLAHSDNLNAMQKAAALNPFDASLEMRLAKKQGDAGKPDAATSAYEKAIATNLSDPSPRIAFLKYLTAHQRFAEADRVATQALAKWPNDPDLLVNHGILAAYFGRSAEAQVNWEKAIAVDPTQTYAHLYLAGQLDSEQKFDAAIPHYMIFLERAAKSGGTPDPNTVLPVLMRLADCNLRANHPERALKLYALGRTIASQTHQPRIESVASVNQAMLESKSGRVNDALPLYQTALKLDRSANDPAAEAADWQAFGVFMNEQGFPKKLAYAALVRAETLLRDATIAPLPKTLQLRAELETALGKDSAAIRKDQTPLLEQALQLQSKK